MGVWGRQGWPDFENIILTRNVNRSSLARRSPCLKSVSWHVTGTCRYWNFPVPWPITFTGRRAAPVTYYISPIAVIPATQVVPGTCLVYGTWKVGELNVGTSYRFWDPGFGHCFPHRFIEVLFAFPVVLVFFFSQYFESNCKPIFPLSVEWARGTLCSLCELPLAPWLQLVTFLPLQLVTVSWPKLD